MKYIYFKLILILGLSHPFDGSITIYSIMYACKHMPTIAHVFICKWLLRNH